MLMVRKEKAKNILIKDENTNLRQEIKDLKANIKLNKEIMTSLYSTTESSKDSIFDKLKEENANLYNSLDKISKERDLLKQKVKYKKNKYIFLDVSN